MSAVLVKAGPHNRKSCLATVALDKAVSVKKVLHLEGIKGEKLPCQVIDGGKALLFKIARLDAGKEASYEIKEGKVASTELSIVKGKEAKSYDIMAGASLFATVHCSQKYAKPFINPLNNISGAPMTRSWPWIENAAGDTNDHVHHRGVWMGLGNLNGSNIWEEYEHHGNQVVKSVEIIERGPIRVALRLNVDWVDCKEKLIASEERILRFAQLDEVRIVDFDSRFTAVNGDVYFGDTKESGFCAVRVPTSMDGDRGGIITLADGSVGESECWGKPAYWCDYYGSVASGKAGICIMDYPDNDGFPTRWHVRAYGLMSANPYATAAYTGSLANDGSFVLQGGATKQWRHRILLHESTLSATHMPEHYQNYAHAPKCSIK